MKKFISAASVIALITLVPAVIVGYLNHGSNNETDKAKTELAKDISTRRDDGNILHLVRTF